MRCFGFIVLRCGRNLCNSCREAPGNSHQKLSQITMMKWGERNGSSSCAYISSWRVFATFSNTITANAQTIIPFFFLSFLVFLFYWRAGWEGEEGGREGGREWGRDWTNRSWNDNSRHTTNARCRRGRSAKVALRPLYCDHYYDAVSIAGLTWSGRHQSQSLDSVNKRTINTR